MGRSRSWWAGTDWVAVSLDPPIWAATRDARRHLPTSVPRTDYARGVLQVAVGATAVGVGR